MWSLLAKLRPIRKVSMSRALSEALALQRRGEARPDGIFSFSFAVKLAVNWRARDLHPWDFDMTEERKAPRLVDQTLHDTEAAIARIFEAFPEVDTLELNVFEKAPDSNRIIIAGVVMRSDLGRCASTSIRMRLRMLGLNYRLKNQHFEPVATGDRAPRPVGQVMQDLVRGGSQDDPASAASIDTQSRPLWPDGDRHPN